MKKLLSIIMIITMAVSLAACSPTGSKNIEGETKEILVKVLEGADVPSDVKEWLKTGLLETELTAENTEYFLGKSDFVFKSATAVEPKMSAQALSIVMVRAEDAAAAEKLKAEVKAAVNPRKWICVGVEDTDVKTEIIGDLMILVMAENSDKYIEAFKALEK